MLLNPGVYLKMISVKPSQDLNATFHQAAAFEMNVAICCEKIADAFGESEFWVAFSYENIFIVSFCVFNGLGEYLRQILCFEQKDFVHTHFYRTPPRRHM